MSYQALIFKCVSTRVMAGMRHGLNPPVRGAISADRGGGTGRGDLTGTAREKAAAG